MYRYIILIFLSFSFSTGIAQRAVISGYVLDDLSGESLIGANVYDTISRVGVITNKYGFYTLFLINGEKAALQYSYVGFKTKECFLQTTKDTNLTISLLPGEELEEVQILAVAQKKLEQRAEIGKVHISIKQIKTIPSITGEPDILKAYQLMPGISMGSEGNNGLFVRGGTPDQNLFLLDEVPLYNVSHLGGMFSVFNPSMVKSIDFYKGGFPARYGGRTSAVVDVRTKDGNLNKTHGELGLSIFLSKFFIEGPIIKEKLSYAFSIRRCNLDLYSYMAKFIFNESTTNGYTFYDINFKSNYIISRSDRIFLNFYNGRDKIFSRSKDKIETPEKFDYVSKINTKWGNSTASLRWYHVFGEAIFNNITFAYTRYRYLNNNYFEKKVFSSESYGLEDEYQFNSGVNDLSLKTDLEIPFAKNQIRIGASYTHHMFTPASVSYSQILSIDGIDTVLNSPEADSKMTAEEFAIYLEFNWQIGRRLSGNLGLRASAYSVDNKVFYSPEPRILFNYLLLDNLSIKASFSTMHQPLHLLTNSNTGLPSDLWLPSTSDIKPEKSNQFSFGIAHTNKKNYEFSIEGYIKKLENLIEYSEGIIVFENSQNWTEKIEANGTGYIQGIEFLCQKKSGRVNGWIGYALSKNERQFDNLNESKKFPFNHDQRHEITIVFNYELSEKLTLSGSWIYHSGHSVTLPTGKYQLQNTNYSDSYEGNRMNMSDVHVYTEKNGYRMPDYHRLDFGINYIKKKKRGISKWSLGVYNVYNRQNAYYLYFKTEDGETKLYQQSLFPILVNFGYSFSF